MTFARSCFSLAACAFALSAPACAQLPAAAAGPAQVRSAANNRQASPAVRSNKPRETLTRPAKAGGRPPAAAASARTTAATPATAAQRATLPNTNAQPAARSIAEALATGQSSPWAIAVGLTLLTLVPAVLLAMTPLVRLLVVFHFLRQALGTQTAPSNQILMALGLMMTWFLMQPVITQIDQQAVDSVSRRDAFG